MKSAGQHAPFCARRGAPFARSALAALTCLAVTGSAEAHTILVSPPPISPVDSAKVGPCGCEFGGDPACPANFETTELTAGDALSIKWKETVQHTGKFRLALSTKAPDQVTGADFDANVVYDKTDNNGVAGGSISTTITVPNTPCDPCTLQLRQFMEGAANPYYYSCASVRIVEASASSSSSAASGSGGVGGDPTGGGDPSSGAGVGGDPFGGAGGSTGPGIATPPSPIQTGGCNAGGASPGAFALFAIGALGLITRLARSKKRGVRVVERTRRERSAPSA